MAREAEAALARLAPLQTGSQGQALEWEREFVEAEPEHRHISHLYALYPGESTDEKLQAAARQSLLLRGDEGTGWSLAWKTAAWESSVWRSPREASREPARKAARKASWKLHFLFYRFLNTGLPVLVETLDVLIQESQTVSQPFLQYGDLFFVAADTIIGKHSDGIELEISVAHAEASEATETASSKHTETFLDFGRLL